MQLEALKALVEREAKRQFESNMQGAAEDTFSRTIKGKAGKIMTFLGVSLVGLIGFFIKLTLDVRDAANDAESAVAGIKIMKIQASFAQAQSEKAMEDAEKARNEAEEFLARLRKQPAIVAAQMEVAVTNELKQVLGKDLHTAQSNITSILARQQELKTVFGKWAKNLAKGHGALTRSDTVARLEQVSTALGRP